MAGERRAVVGDARFADHHFGGAEVDFGERDVRGRYAAPGGERLKPVGHVKPRLQQDDSAVDDRCGRPTGGRGDPADPPRRSSLETTRLDVEESAKALLAQSVNMRRVRELGLRALCHLATRNPLG